MAERRLHGGAHGSLVGDVALHAEAAEFGSGRTREIAIEVRHDDALRTAPQHFAAQGAADAAARAGHECDLACSVHRPALTE